MATNIVVPELGESIYEATVVRWLKQEGEPISLGEAIVEMETEKANFEIGAEQAGVLARIEHKEGEDVKVGDVLGVIEEGGAEKTGEAKKAPEKAEKAPKEEKLKEEEAKEEKEPPAKEKERELRVVKEEAEEKPSREAAEERVTPVARRIAEEHGIELSKVTGTGPSNRITKEDVESYVEKQKAQPEAAPQERKEKRAEPEVEREEPTPPLEERGRREERVKMSRRRRTIARRMVEAQHNAAMLTTFNEIDMTAVMELRKRRKDSFKERYRVSLGLSSFFVKAVIGALKAFPQINAEIQEDYLIFKHYYDIGMAIGASQGLVVPVLRDADRMTFAQIEKAVRDLAQKAEDGSLSLEDLRGGTFTITNGGVFGSLMSTPILNPPQSGILGLHKIEDRPVVIKGEIVIRPMMYVALSYDHRVVDGREAVQFLVKVKQLIEDPEVLLIEG
ncbi:MAG TPA: 2-oxoglutarate dehydrogenase complex dihydrolipoyllysine-residue succinyltransferase [Thermodesulfobacteriota bacterium]|nr:2-oxoglutarate dehydrogenase complex dihydrolipoyllysine-residue succinyltransferase [Thermodesulfobacteriota bacterium]